MTAKDFLNFAKTLYHFNATELTELAALYPLSNFLRTVPRDQYDLP
jgi:hypothetical protein